MRTEGKYILDDKGNPVEEHDLMVWGEWFETHRKDRILKQDRIGPYFVSTVFLGLNWNFNPKGTPILWETMIFTDETGGSDERRYYTREEALKGHEEALAEYTYKHEHTNKNLGPHE